MNTKILNFIKQILTIISMSFLIAIISSITPDKYESSVMFLIGWWFALIWNILFIKK